MSRRCTAICKDGSPCEGWAERGSDPPRCGVHGPHRNPRAPADRRCTAICKDGSPCRGWAVPGTDPPRCGVHGPNHTARAPADRRCTAICKDGSPCEGWAERGSDPPRCGVHGGGSRPIGPPKGHQNALKHGYFAKLDLPRGATIDDLIEELFRRYKRLHAYIDEVFEANNPSVAEVIHLCRTQGEAATKLRKLLLDRRALAEARAAIRRDRVLNQALEEPSEELGTEL